MTTLTIAHLIKTLNWKRMWERIVVNGYDGMVASFQTIPTSDELAQLRQLIGDFRPEATFSMRTPYELIVQKSNTLTDEEPKLDFLSTAKLVAFRHPDPCFADELNRIYSHAPLEIVMDDIQTATWETNWQAKMKCAVLDGSAGFLLGFSRALCELTADDRSYLNELLEKQLAYWHMQTCAEIHYDFDRKIIGVVLDSAQRARLHVSASDIVYTPENDGIDPYFSAMMSWTDRFKKKLRTMENVIDTLECHPDIGSAIHAAKEDFMARNNDACIH